MESLPGEWRQESKELVCGPCESLPRWQFNWIQSPLCPSKMSRKYVFNFIVRSEPQKLNNEIYEGKKGMCGRKFRIFQR